MVETLMTSHGELLIMGTIMVWLFGANSEDLSQLPYITMFVKETLRLYPIAPYMAKLSSEEVIVNGQRIYKVEL